jgi:hypothetical protein
VQTRDLSHRDARIARGVRNSPPPSSTPLLRTSREHPDGASLRFRMADRGKRVLFAKPGLLGVVLSERPKHELGAARLHLRTQKRAPGRETTDDPDDLVLRFLGLKVTELRSEPNQERRHGAGRG